MAIAVVQTSSEGRVSSGSATASFASTPTVGNKIVATVAMWNGSGAPSGTVTDNKGNTWTRRATRSQGLTTVEIWEAPITVTGSSFSMSCAPSIAGSEINLIGCEYSGLGAYDQNVVGGGTAATTSLALTTGTLAAAESLLASVISADSGTSNAGWTVPTSFTQVGAQQSSNVILAYASARRVVTGTGAQTSTWTYNSQVSITGALAVFSASASGVTLTASGQTLGVPTQSTAAAVRASLTASQSLGVPTQSTSFQAFDSLSASQTLPLPTQAATLRAIASLSASQTLTVPSQSAQVGTPPATLTAAQTLAVPTQATALAVRAGLTASHATPVPTQAATAKVTASLLASQTLPLPSQAAVASTFIGRALAADQLLPVPANIFVSVAIVAGSAAQTLPLPGQVLRARHTDWDADAPPPGGWSVDPSDVLSWLPQDPATGSWS